MIYLKTKAIESAFPQFDATHIAVSAIQEKLLSENTLVRICDHLLAVYMAFNRKR